MSLRVPVARRAEAPVGDAWVRKLVEAALKGAKAERADEVGVVFVDDKEMIALNAAHRGKKKTTDVLSFGNDGAWEGEGGAGLLGDIVISVPQVRRQAAEAGKPLRSELALMLVHGTLHLLGYDHETLKDEKKMFGLQKRILKKLGYA
jgi:probable rRNA maturation factor